MQSFSLSLDPFEKQLYLVLPEPYKCLSTYLFKSLAKVHFF
jgi:hypothetical protein